MPIMLASMALKNVTFLSTSFDCNSNATEAGHQWIGIFSIKRMVSLIAKSSSQSLLATSDVSEKGLGHKPCDTRIASLVY